MMRRARVIRVVGAAVLALAIASCQTPGSKGALSGSISGPITASLPQSLAAAVVHVPAIVGAGSPAVNQHSALLHPKSKYYGLDVPGVPHTFDVVNQVTSRLHRSPGLIEYFQDWTHDFDTQGVQNACDSGVVPVLTWESWSWEDSLNGSPVVKQPAYAPRKIANGKYDGYIRRTAKAIGALHCSIMLRLDQEPNGYWYPWGLATKGMHNTPAQYVRMWRHVEHIFDQVGTHNVAWMWSPNYLYNGRFDRVRTTYPGDSYVDVVGIDGYLLNKTSTVADVFGPIMSQLKSVAGSKPWIIAETGASSGSAQPHQIRTILRLVAQTKRLIGFAYFDQPASRANWVFDTNQASLRAFRHGLADPAFDLH